MCNVAREMSHQLRVHVTLAQNLTSYTYSQDEKLTPTCVLFSPVLEDRDNFEFGKTEFLFYPNHLEPHDLMWLVVARHRVLASEGPCISITT